MKSRWLSPWIEIGSMGILLRAPASILDLPAMMHHKKVLDKRQRSPQRTREEKSAMIKYLKDREVYGTVSMNSYERKCGTHPQRTRKETSAERDVRDDPDKSGMTTMRMGETNGTRLNGILPYFIIGLQMDDTQPLIYHKNRYFITS